MKKLTIHRETIRNLSAKDLQQVHGGTGAFCDPVTDAACNTAEACGGGGDTADCSLTCAGEATCWVTCFMNPNTCFRNC